VAKKTEMKNETKTENASENKAGHSLETKMQALENIVLQLEKGDVSLEDSVKLYTDGVTLVADCRKEIENAKQKIIINDGE
jgi:exodeoxyribonuclease VII small subunit